MDDEEETVDASQVQEVVCVEMLCPDGQVIPFELASDIGGGEVSKLIVWGHTNSQGTN